MGDLTIESPASANPCGSQGWATYGGSSENCYEIGEYFYFRRASAEKNLACLKFATLRKTRSVLFFLIVGILNRLARGRADIAKDQMAKGQKRSSKEARKPKQPVAKPPEPSRGAAMGGVFRKT